MTTLYATITDINYLVRAWALYKSFSPWLDGKIFAFYCIDTDSLRLLRALAPRNAWILGEDDFQSPALRQARADRQVNEYCWTCKPAILLDAFQRDPALEWGVYLDSDMLVFGDPDLGLMPNSHITLTPHRSSPHFKEVEAIAGKFNAGYAGFRNSSVGKAALEWWLSLCLELCPNKPVNGAYADQKYLDMMPEHFGDVGASLDIGLNAAPWNLNNYAITEDNDSVYLDGNPLLLYHFQALRIHGLKLFDLYPGPMPLGAMARRAIYAPYVNALCEAYSDIRKVSPDFEAGIKTLTLRNWITQTAKLARGHCNLVMA